MPDFLPYLMDLAVGLGWALMGVAGFGCAVAFLGWLFEKGAELLEWLE